MSQEFGLYVVTRLAAALLATTATGPVGQVDLPQAALSSPRAAPAGIVEFADGTLAGQLGRAGQGSLSQGAAPELFIKALIASEDGDFFAHPGVDPVATLRAVIAQLSGGRVQGASSLVQQAVKNGLLTPERSMARKTSEAVTAVRLAALSDKRAILGMYLDLVYFGRGAHGFAGAAQAWFGRDWDNLSVGEVAFIAGVIQSPAYLDPVRNPERAIGRRNYVLDRMIASGVIDEVTGAAEKAKPLEVAPVGPGLPAPNWVTNLVAKTWPEEGRPGPGEKQPVIRTTINAGWQDLIEASLPRFLREKFEPASPGSVNLSDGLTEDDWADARALLPGPSSAWQVGIVTEPGKVQLVDGTSAEIAGRYDRGDVVAVSTLDGSDVTPPGVQGAVVVMEAATGAILGASGGYDATMNGFNRAFGARQPGSSIKPFLWLAALNVGFAYDTMVLDSPVTVTTAGGETWTPENYDRLYSGAMPLYAALEQSSNLVAARLGQDVGIDHFAAISESAGVYPAGGMRQHPSAVLGTSESSLIAMVGAYAAIANGGTIVQPHAIKSVSGGQMQWTRSRPSALRLPVEEQTISDLTAMLRGVITRGTASVAFADHPVKIAGKTGTSQSHRDAWFIGFTPDIVIGVWLGRDDASPIAGGATGGTLSAAIAAEILEGANTAGLIPDTQDSWPPAVFSARAIQGLGTWTPERGLGQESQNSERQAPAAPAVYDDYFRIDNPNADLLDNQPRQDGGLVFRSPW